MTFVDQLAQAIATMEGYYKSNTIAQRNNNPGNLRTWGSRPVVNGYAYFDTPEQGWEALRRQVERNIGRGLNLQEFFAGQRDTQGNVIPGGYSGYAPAADKNNPTGYAAFVAKRVGVPVDQPLVQAQLAFSRSPSPLPAPGASPSLPAAPWIQTLNPGAQDERKVIYAALAVAAAAVVWMIWEG